jgi:hypothetical protein
LHFSNAGRKTLISVHLWGCISICQLLYAHPLLMGYLRRVIGPPPEAEGSSLSGTSTCSPMGIPWEYSRGGQNPIDPFGPLWGLCHAPLSVGNIIVHALGFRGLHRSCIALIRILKPGLYLGNAEVPFGLSEVARAFYSLLCVGACATREWLGLGVS